MPVQYGMEFACKVAVESMRRMVSVFDLPKVVDVVADGCMMEDKVDRCSS